MSFRLFYCLSVCHLPGPLQSITDKSQNGRKLDRNCLNTIILRAAGRSHIVASFVRFDFRAGRLHRTKVMNFMPRHSVVIST
jgi:hypothetical protein